MKNLYYVAVYAPDDVNSRIEEIKYDFCNRFSSCRALRNKAHITLVDPFTIQAEDEDLYISLFKTINPVEKFSVSLNGYGAFPHLRNPVIFIQPEENAALAELYHNTRKKMIWQRKAFLPHITVAYRDLSFENFERAWEEYQHKEFKASFEVAELQFLKHDGKQWKKISGVQLL